MRRSVAALTLAVLAGCGSTESQTVAGSYALVSVNGAALPYVSSPAPGDTATLLNETLALAGDGTFTRTGAYRLALHGIPTTTTPYSIAGTFTRSTDGVILYPNGTASPVNASLAGNTLTTTSGEIRAYRR